MRSRPKIVAVIPARIGSTRLPRKMLREVAGEPLVCRVHRAIAGSPSLMVAVVATDSEEIMAACRAHGCECRMTSTKHLSGTERVNEVAQAIDADIYLNIQGDEPLVRPEHVEALASTLGSGAEVGTLMTRAAPDDLRNSNVVKVVTDLSLRALYFSRATIPFDRDRVSPEYKKHLGFYAYTKAALAKFCSLPESSLERAERLEQLRFIENGIGIQLAETQFDTVAIDTEDDLRRVEGLLLKR